MHTGITLFMGGSSAPRKCPVNIKTACKTTLLFSCQSFVKPVNLQRPKWRNLSCLETMFSSSQCSSFWRIRYVFLKKKKSWDCITLFIGFIFKSLVRHRVFGFIRENGPNDRKINVFSLFQDIVGRTNRPCLTISHTQNSQRRQWERQNLIGKV